MVAFYSSKHKLNGDSQKTCINIWFEQPYICFCDTWWEILWILASTKWLFKSFRKKTFSSPLLKPIWRNLKVQSFIKVFLVRIHSAPLVHNITFSKCIIWERTISKDFCVHRMKTIFNIKFSTTVWVFIYTPTQPTL